MPINIICIGIGIIIGIVVMLVAYVMYMEEGDEVVSCKDCRWYNSKGFCEHWLRETDEDDFCSYQERRESGYEEEWQKWDANYSVRSNLEQFRAKIDYTPDCPFCKRYGTRACLGYDCRHYKTYRDKPQTEREGE